MSKTVDRAVNAVIRPPRKKYDESKIPLFLKGEDSITYIRLPLDFVNKRNIHIVGSYYYSSSMDPNGGGPCVIYLHGNASSQLEGQFLVSNLCKYGIFVYCFDFAGCGCSDGEYVSLGYYEKEDTEFIIDELHSQLHLGPFILWGRSMGAATSLLVDHPLVIGRISDSSFTSIQDMCTSVALSYHLSPVFIPAAIWILKQHILKKAKFDIMDVSPVSVSYKHVVPVLFGHAKNDQFIPFYQCKRLYIHYPSSEKDIITLQGGHNSRRTRNWISSCVTFILHNFNIDVENPEIYTNRILQENVFHFKSFNDMVKEFQYENENKRRRKQVGSHNEFGRESHFKLHEHHHHKNNDNHKAEKDNNDNNIRHHHKTLDANEVNKNYHENNDHHYIMHNINENEIDQHNHNKYHHTNIETKEAKRNDQNMQNEHDYNHHQHHHHHHNDIMNEHKENEHEYNKDRHQIIRENVNKRVEHEHHYEHPHHHIIKTNETKTYHYDPSSFHSKNKDLNDDKRKEHEHHHKNFKENEDMSKHNEYYRHHYKIINAHENDEDKIHHYNKKIDENEDNNINHYKINKTGSKYEKNKYKHQKTYNWHVE